MNRDSVSALSQFVFGCCCSDLKQNQVLCCVGCVRPNHSSTIGDVLLMYSTSYSRHDRLDLQADGHAIMDRLGSVVVSD